MIDVYRAIGAQAERAEPMEAPFGIVCRSASESPVGNFAITDCISESTIESVRAFAQDRFRFYVYSYGAIGDAPAEKLMGRFGFKHSGTMCSMARAPAATSALTAVELNLCKGSDSRKSASTFIASQFFSRQPPAARLEVASATDSCGMPIYWIVANGVRVGALMLGRDDLTVGIYNFCIDSRYRLKGFGSSAVAHLSSHKMSGNRQICLQCDPGLVDWYERLGFKVLEHVDVWSLE